MTERPEKCPVCGDPSFEALADDDEDFWGCFTCGWTQGEELPTRMQQLTERDLML